MSMPIDPEIEQCCGVIKPVAKNYSSSHKLSNSYNKLHPKNPYANKPPDFYDLFKRYPKIVLSCIPDFNPDKKLKIDWSDARIARACTELLLQHDFDLCIELPKNYLCPPLPNRINYLCWMSDLMETMIAKADTRVFSSNHDVDNEESITIDQIPLRCRTALDNQERSVTILDIGVGASCIYPLLGRKLFSYQFYGSDINPSAIASANNNIELNKKQLKDRIPQLINVGASSQIQEIITAAYLPYFFKGQKHQFSDTVDVGVSLMSLCSGAELKSLSDHPCRGESSALSHHTKISQGQQASGLCGPLIAALNEIFGVELIRKVITDNLNGTALSLPLPATMNIAASASQSQSPNYPDASENCYNEKRVSGHFQDASDCSNAMKRRKLSETLSIAEKNQSIGKFGERNPIATKQSIDTNHAQCDRTEYMGGEALLSACMCNPPFYDIKEEVQVNPETSCTGNEYEMRTVGGEIAFITAIIADSLKIRKGVVWYTSMVGKKSSLTVLERVLRHEGIPPQNIRTTALQQGLTTRWALAWTFYTPLNTPLYSNPSIGLNKTNSVVSSNNVHNKTTKQGKNTSNDSSKEAVKSLYETLDRPASLSDNKSHSSHQVTINAEEFKASMTDTEKEQIKLQLQFKRSELLPESNSVNIEKDLENKLSCCVPQGFTIVFENRQLFGTCLLEPSINSETTNIMSTVSTNQSCADTGEYNSNNVESTAIIGNKPSCKIVIEQLFIPALLRVQTAVEEYNETLSLAHKKNLTSGSTNNTDVKSIVIVHNKNDIPPILTTYLHDEKEGVLSSGETAFNIRTLNNNSTDCIAAKSTAVLRVSYCNCTSRVGNLSDDINNAVMNTEPPPINNNNIDINNNDIIIDSVVKKSKPDNRTTADSTATASCEIPHKHNYSSPSAPSDCINTSCGRCGMSFWILLHVYLHCHDKNSCISGGDNNSDSSSNNDESYRITLCITPVDHHFLCRSADALDNTTANDPTNYIIVDSKECSTHKASDHHPQIMCGVHFQQVKDALFSSFIRSNRKWRRRLRPVT